MPRTEVEGLSIAYDVVGEGQPWIVTPGGRFSKDYPGVRELAVAIAEHGNRVVIWDRPNCGESEVCFRGDSESEMQADVLAGLLRELDLAPAVIVGGSGGARVSLLAANRHPDVASAVARVVDQRRCLRPPVARLLLLRARGPRSLERWDGGGDRHPELGRGVRALPAEPRTPVGPGPEGVHRRDGAMDGRVLQLRRRRRPGFARRRRPPAGHPGAGVPQRCLRLQPSPRTSEQVAALLPNSRLVEPPWPDTEWIDRARGVWQGFERWPLLAPQLVEWANTALR